jgi:hypothetical protein
LVLAAVYDKTYCVAVAPAVAVTPEEEMESEVEAD